MALAKELEIQYATVAMVTNYAAGVAKYELSHKEVLDTMADNAFKLRNLLETAIPLIGCVGEECGLEREEKA